MGNEINKDYTDEIGPVFNNTRHYYNSNEDRRQCFNLHKEETLRKQRNRYHQNKENKREYARNYYYQNKDKIKESRDKYKEKIKRK